MKVYLKTVEKNTHLENRQDSEKNTSPKTHEGSKRVKKWSTSLATRAPQIKTATRHCQPAMSMGEIYKTGSTVGQ